MSRALRSVCPCADGTGRATAAAQKAVAEAEAYLEEVKKSGGEAQGAIWWMERELLEAKKYLPLSKGGIARK